MKTVIDSKILFEFFHDQPDQFPIGDLEENRIWTAFFTFLRCETDVIVYNFKDLRLEDEIFINNLTTGRGHTKIILDEKKINHQNFKLKSDKPLTFYCLSEELEENRQNFLKKNGYLIAFDDDYLEKWKKLRFLNQSLSVRKKYSEFIKWTQLKNFLFPFTDVIIIDRYIFSDSSLIDSNILEILKNLDAATPLPYNLTIFTIEERDQRKRIDYRIIEGKLIAYKQKYNLKYNFEIIITPYSIEKEHDRNILTNYIKIFSGDSFNYFNSNGEIITNTEIQFASLAIEDKFLSAKNILRDIAMTINDIKKNNSENYVFGKCKNQLLILKEN